MSGKTKLELTWIGKHERPRLEPRILLEDPERSYHAARGAGDHDGFRSMPDESLEARDELLFRE